MPAGYTRDLREHVDQFGNIAVDVEIGGGPGAWPEEPGHRRVRLAGDGGPVPPRTGR